MLNPTTCPVGFLSRATLLNSTEIEQLEDSLQANVASSTLLACILLAASLVVLFAGSKLVKPTLFCAGFGAFYVCALIGTNASLVAAPSLSPTASCVLLGTVPCVLGLLGGLTALCILKMGFALLGAGAGAGLGYVMYNAGLIRVASPSVGPYDLVFVLCLSLGALIGMLLLLKFERDILIVATAAAGASACTPNVVLLLAHANVRIALPENEYAWALALATLVLFAFGVAVQCKCARKKKPVTEPEPHRPRLNTPLMSP